jgi:hypothetical protein
MSGGTLKPLEPHRLLYRSGLGGDPLRRGAAIADAS